MSVDLPAPPQPRIDPRIRRRRIEVQRSEGRRRLRHLLASLAVVAVVGLAVLATRSPLLDVDYVDVQGTRHTSRAQLLRATGLDDSPLLVDVDVDAVARRARTLPWVESATATRRWPRSVHIRITERVPVAVMPAPGGRWALVDGHRRVLEVVAARPAGLPAVVGTPPPGAPGSELPGDVDPALSVVAALPPVLRDRVDGVRLEEGRTLKLELRGGGVVQLGPSERLAEKLLAVTTVVEKVDMRGVAVIDVRVPTAPVLTRR